MEAGVEAVVGGLGWSVFLDMDWCADPKWHAGRHIPTVSLRDERVSASQSVPKQ